MVEDAVVEMREGIRWSGGRWGDKARGRDAEIQSRRIFRCASLVVEHPRRTGILCVFGS